MKNEQRFSHIALGPEVFQGIEHKEGVETPFSAGWPLFLIGQARSRGCDFEDEADGYGEGEGTHEDWSGIRDSSFRALERMTEKALNYLFSFGEGSGHLIRHMFDGSDGDRRCGCRPAKPCGLHTPITITAPKPRRS